MPPLVTVITATFNCSPLLRSSLACLLDQQYEPFEAWIVGDACTDDSEAVVASFGDARLNWVNLDRNSGSQSAPNNEGIRRARGDLIAYLGHDDLWFPWHLAGLVRRIEDGRTDFAHALTAVFDGKGVCGVSGPPPPALAYRDHPIPPSSWLHRRALSERLGSWRDPASLGWGSISTSRGAQRSRTRRLPSCRG